MWIHVQPLLREKVRPPFLQYSHEPTTSRRNSESSHKEWLWRGKMTGFCDTAYLINSHAR